jgi:hypothetical protein
MADTASPRYQQLPGTGYRQLVPTWALVLLFFVIGIFVLLLRGRRVQLWLGDDHLLLVEWDGYREYYKRFRYEDIQAIVVNRTAVGKIANAVLGVIVLIFCSLAVGMGVTSGDPFSAGVFLAPAAIFALILLVNFLQGPTCKCQLRTAVQTEELHSLTRLRNARKVLDRLRPLIAVAQGSLTPEEIESHLRKRIAVPGSEPPLMQPAVEITDNSDALEPS